MKKTLKQKLSIKRLITMLMKTTWMT